MKHFFILLFITIYFHGYAKMDQTDIVYFTKEDQANCALDLKNESRNALVIEYIDAQNIRHKKNAGEIYGYQTSQGELYISKKVVIDGLDREYFVHVLAKGYAALYTAHIEDLGLVKFVEINGQIPVIIKEGFEVNTLTYLFNTCDLLTQEYIAQARPDLTENLASLVVEYGQCMEPEIENKVITQFPKNKLVVHPGLFVGVDFVKLKNMTKGDDYNSKYNFVVGVNCDFMVGQKLALTPALLYSKNDYYTERPSSLYPESITVKQNFYMSRLQGELAVKWFFSQSTLKPYISVAPVFTLGSDIYLETRLYDIDGDEIPATDNTIEYSTVGGRAAIGAKYSIKKLKVFVEFRYGYEQVNPKAGDMDSDECVMNSTQFILGISL